MRSNRCKASLMRWWVGVWSFVLFVWFYVAMIAEGVVLGLWLLAFGVTVGVLWARHHGKPGGVEYDNPL